MDWREDLLYMVEDTAGDSFRKKEFVSTDTNDHEHCTICWEKISCNDNQNIGYYCEKNNYWLCCECFYDFKDRYNWTENKVNRQHR